MVWISYPFDKVFLMAMMCAVVEDVFNFEFVVVVDGDRVWWRHWRWTVCNGVRSLVWSEDRYMKDWVYLECFREVEFVSDR